MDSTKSTKSEGGAKPTINQIAFMLFISDFVHNFVWKCNEEMFTGFPENTFIEKPFTQETANTFTKDLIDEFVCKLKGISSTMDKSKQRFLPFITYFAHEFSKEFLKKFNSVFPDYLFSDIQTQFIKEFEYQCMRDLPGKLMRLNKPDCWDAPKTFMGFFYHRSNCSCIICIENREDDEYSDYSYDYDDDDICGAMLAVNSMLVGQSSNSWNPSYSKCFKCSKSVYLDDYKICLKCNFKNEDRTMFCCKCGSGDLEQHLTCTESKCQFENYGLGVPEFNDTKKLFGEKKRHKKKCMRALKKKAIILTKQNRKKKNSLGHSAEIQSEEEDVFESPLSAQESNWKNSQKVSEREWQASTDFCRRDTKKKRMPGRNKKRSTLIEID
jgi:ribosomal protein L40E